ncbi:PREDICTED: uncharacterized protein LOC108371351 [Rhagoletis zephyria]|uniref:uncharacterized protein LOC108371351 n=1 Tax=Rhagoletis zephyria TaxID=28612 RepID=UPI00081123EC|nr:PREDICTED: uncharacterized protein LOC108371351 [Rhagoletis zephyria]
MEPGQTDTGKTNDMAQAAHSGASNDEFFEAFSPSQLQQPPATHIDRFERLELPPFWSQQIQLWFVAIEAQFQLRKITADTTKYYAVVARLDQDSLITVESIISNPPETDKYATLKEALINHFAIPQERRFKMLLSGMELRERRPSELLAEINRLGGNHLDAAFVRTIWLDRLPLQIQLALTATGELDNARLAQLANNLMEIQRNSENHCVMPVAHKSDSSSGMQKQLDDLAKQVEKLVLKLNQSASVENSRKHPNNTANVSRSTDASATPLNCYYHRRFGARANKCTQPCAFQGNTNRPQ